MIPLSPLSRFEWERVIMDVRLPPMTKLVALALATFANRSGGNAHPGNKRLALTLGISERTVERQLARLRADGLLEQTFCGKSAGRRGLASVYQLAIADDLPNRVRFVGTPDPRVGSSEESVPDTTVGSSDPEHPTGGEEHPTPVTRTPDTGGRTPDPGVGTPCTYNNPDQQEGLSSSADSIGASAKPSSDDANDREHQTNMATLKRLPDDLVARLLTGAHEDVGDQGWPAVVARAVELASVGAVA